jgi:superfamily II DNA helicase RecQ
MQHKSPVVAIMGTGAGKSVLFMLPASVSSGVTIVVVPLVALRFDMKDRCEQLGIVSAEWNSRRPHEWAQVVFITPEAAVGEAFGHYIN